MFLSFRNSLTSSIESLKLQNIIPLPLLVRAMICSRFKNLFLESDASVLICRTLSVFFSNFKSCGSCRPTNAGTSALKVADVNMLRPT